MNAANYPLGDPVPFIEHAISVSLPRWQDVVGYEENSFEVVNKMQTGYPRFFIHKSIQKVSLGPFLAYAMPANSKADNELNLRAM